MTLFEIIWYIYLPYMAFIIPILMVVGFVFWYKRRVPAAVRTLYAAARKAFIPIILCHDSGRAKIILATERKGEGVLLTTDGRYKLVPRYVREGNPEPKADAAPYQDWTNKRSILVGLGQPCYVGYSGTLCLMNPLTLAMVEAGEMYVQTVDKPIISDKAKDKPLDELVQPLMLLDPKESKEIINKQYNATQVAACLVDSEEIGRIGRPSWFSQNLPILFILGIIVVAGIALYFLPDIMQRFA